MTELQCLTPRVRGWDCPRALVETGAPGVIGIEADDLVVVLDRPVAVLLIQPGVAVAAISERVCWIEPDSLVEIMDCLVVFLFIQPSGAAFDVRERVRLLT
jgi:hypothetical protein